MDPGPSPSKKSGGQANFRAILRLLPYLWPKGSIALRTRVTVALLSIVAAKGVGVVVPIFYKEAVDALGVEGGAAAIPLGAIVGYGLARIISLAFNQLREIVFERVEQQAVRRAAIRVFEHLHALPLAFHLGRQTGGLGRAIERGTRAMSSLLSVTLFNLLPTLFELILVVAVLLGFFDSRFALVVGATVVSYAAFTIMTTEWRLKFRRRLVEADKVASTRAVDSLLNFETVKYFGNEGLEADRYDSALKSYEEAAVKSQSSLGLLNLGQAAIVAGGLTFLMWMAAGGIVDGTMSVGDFVLVNTYLMQLAQPLNIFGWVYRSVKQNLVDMDHMFELLEEQSAVPDAPDAEPLIIPEGRVRFEDVSFGYDARRPILKGVSFEIPPGQTVALVGPSGGGKSTIARLLFRFWDPGGGRISIDGQDLREVTQESLRNAVGIVPQDTVLFNESIEYNLEYARPGATRSELEEAARLAAIAGFIKETPDGWSTEVGERGLKLSGGEKQRMAIARVFLKGPRVVVLDEATSALDTATEREIQDNLRDVARGRTTLVIAHRLSTVVDADEILVLDQGQVVERGRHEDLLEQGGLYAAMWQRQRDEEAEAA